ncbi:MAG: hypothetical protein NTZ19_02135 [Bacteroidetes bacterium]|nr:hypothetical protein [Bacteroidota bacterium]
MKTKKLKLFANAAAALLSILILLNACSKGGSAPTSPTTPTTPTTPTDACAGKTITVTGTATIADPCTGAKVSVSASGSTGFTFSIDGGSFDASTDFNNVKSGDHTISAKDAAGCVQSTKVTVTQTTAGPLFSAVKSLIQAQCSSCHSGAGSSAGRDWSVDCNVIANKALIKQRVVDGSPSFMPQSGKLSASDLKIYTDWVNAGGRYSD